MTVHTFRPAGVGTLVCVLSMLAGCQSYQPKPLDPQSHREVWHERTPGDETVRVFASSLAESGYTDAAGFDPEDGLSLPEAELVALVFNPDLRLARLRLGMVAVSAEHAGRWDDPEAAIDVLRITESVSNRWVITPSLAFTVPISGRLEAEKARAEAALAAELEQVAESEWQTRLDVRVAWLTWSAARLREAETEKLIDSMAGLVDSTRQLAETGEIPRTEAALFEIEHMQRRNALRRLRGDLVAAEQRLRSLMGLSPDAPVSLQPSLEGLDAPLDMPFDAIAERSVTLSRLRAEYEEAEQVLRREVRKQYPDLTIGPLYESDQGQSRIGFLGGLPLPVFNANRQGIAEAWAERELARAAYETAYERLVGSVSQVRARIVSLQAQRNELTTDLAPRVDQQLDDARRLLELGEGGGLVLLESLVRAYDTKLSLVDVRLDEARAVAELSYLAGPADRTGTQPVDEPAAPTGSEVNP